MSAGGTAQRIAAVARKEAAEVLHQPRLLLTLAVGPVVVIALFGVGFSDRLPTFRTMFVAPEGSPARQVVEEHSDQLADYISYEGTIGDAEDAIRRLERGDLDIVAILPDAPYADVLSGRRAIIEVVHASADPLIAQAIEIAARLAADEINRQIVADVVAEGQRAGGLVTTAIPLTRLALAGAADALRSGDRLDGERRLDQQVPGLFDLATGVEDAGQLVEDLPATAGGLVVGDRFDQLRVAIDDLAGGDGRTSTEERLAQIAAVDRSLEAIQVEFRAIQDVEPRVLVRPFRAISRGLGGLTSSPVPYYAPAAVVLLLQHLGVTFPALSFVRERQLGISDVLGVAPVSAGEVLVGKLLSYLALGGALAAVLLLGLRHAAGVPFAGDLGDVLVSVATVLLASLAIGFVISLVARTDGQAVQLSMLVLLASFFFTGFFLPLDRLDPPATWLADLIPATHGIELLRTVLLLGGDPDPALLGRVLLIAGVAAALSWLRLRRSLRPGAGRDRTVLQRSGARDRPGERRLLQGRAGERRRRPAEEGRPWDVDAGRR